MFGTAVIKVPMPFPCLQFLVQGVPRTSNFQKTQGTLRGTLRYGSNRISACCALNFCTFLPFLRLRIHVEDVNVNA